MARMSCAQSGINVAKLLRRPTVFCKLTEKGVQKTAANRGRLAAAARFGARLRAGAAEEVRFGVRCAPSGAQTPENGAESTASLRTEACGSIRGKV